MVDGSCCAITVAGLLGRFSCGVDERQRMCIAISDHVRTHAAQPPAIEELSTCPLAMQHSVHLQSWQIRMATHKATTVQIRKAWFVIIITIISDESPTSTTKNFTQNKNHPKVPRELPFWQRWSHPSCSPESRDSFCKRLVASATHESRKNIEFNHHTKNIEIV